MVRRRPRTRTHHAAARLWQDKDVFTVPTWTMHEHVNTGSRPTFLFSFTDAPVMKALDLYREDAKR
jgi:gentisate 1,2-dioxygenase